MRTDASVGAVVLAAGASRRFGSPKQLAPVGGVPMLSAVIANLADAGVTEVAVVLGAHADELRDRMSFSSVRLVINRDWPEGPGSSLAAGLAALGACEAALVLLGDQPWIGARAIARIIALRAPGRLAIRASYGGAPGHPVLIEREAWPHAGLVPAGGARHLFDRPGSLTVPFDGFANPRDVDVPADLRRD